MLTKTASALMLSFTLLTGVSMGADIDALLSGLAIQRLSGDDAAPDFTLLSTDGRKVSLSGYKGSPVLLHFWATWCVPCREELPSIERAYSEYNGRGLRVLAVSIDTAGMDAVAAFAEKSGLTFPVLIAAGGGIKQGYWTWGVPVSYLIDRRQRIIGRAIGPRDWQSAQAKALFEELVKK